MAYESPAPMRQVKAQELPLPMAGGNSFGRYKKISNAQTWNMIVSDGALVDYAGYKAIFDVPLVDNAKGRGIYSSATGDIMVVVIGSAVYAIHVDPGDTLIAVFVGEIETSEGDVFLSENNNYQIVITDEEFMYVYNYKTNPSGPLLQSINSMVPTPGRFYAPFVSPGYVTFQDGRLIVADIAGQRWDLSGINDATQWDVGNTSNPAYQGALTLKPDTIQAVVAFPGAGDNLVVFGHTVMELWQGVNNAVFPYQRATTFNVDYGCLNASSIAALDSFIVWLAANEQSGVTIMRINGAGGREEPISTDGIDFKLNNITDPTNCTGFLFRQDGHLLYQFTFPADNISYVYDFETKLFSTVSDENQNYHIARNVVFFDNKYYFVSLNDGNVYEFGTQFTNLQYAPFPLNVPQIKQMPRIRILPPIRVPSQRMFICKSVAFTIENGQPNTQQMSDQPIQLITQDGNLLITQDSKLLVTQQNQTLIGEFTEAIDLRVSRDGGENFSSAMRYYMNPTGKRKSRLIFQRLGQANDLTIQIQFVGFGRFVAVGDGIAEIYQ